jgi:hypothetical protein
VQPRNVRKADHQAVNNLVDAGFFRSVRHVISVEGPGHGVNESLRQ